MLCFTTPYDLPISWYEPGSKKDIVGHTWKPYTSNTSTRPWSTATDSI